MICPGIVTNVTNFGAFVDIGVHQDGLVHISELSHNFVKDPRLVVNPGDQVKIRVLGVDKEKNQISLSMKLEAPAPRVAREAPTERPPRRDEGGRGPRRDGPPREGGQGRGPRDDRGPRNDQRSAGGGGQRRDQGRPQHNNQNNDQRGPPRPAAKPFNNPFAALQINPNSNKK